MSPLRRSLARLVAPALLALLALSLAACAESALEPTTAGADLDSTVTVLTQNLYLGSSLTPLSSVASLADVPAAGGTVWAMVQRTSFPERAGALARLIADAHPDLVGLQEAALWRTHAPTTWGIGSTTASTVAYDFLALLLDSLAARGAPYVVVATHQGFDGQAPASTADGTIDVRITDRDVLLARAGVRVTNARAGSYSARLTQLGALPLAVPRGWVSGDVTVGGRTVRVVSTHLEVEDYAAVQEAQGAELAALVQDAPAAIVLGDLNSPADGSTTTTYASLAGAGLADAWTAARPGEPGLTCCQVEDLRNAEPTLAKRIDDVLTRGALAVERAAVVGATAGDRTASGLWPADHAGLVVTLRPR